MFNAPGSWHFTPGCQILTYRILTKHGLGWECKLNMVASYTNTVPYFHCYFIFKGHKGIGNYCFSIFYKDSPGCWLYMQMIQIFFSFIFLSLTENTFLYCSVTNDISHMAHAIMLQLWFNVNVGHTTIIYVCEMDVNSEEICKGLVNMSASTLVQFSSVQFCFHF